MACDDVSFKVLILELVRFIFVVIPGSHFSHLPTSTILRLVRPLDRAGTAVENGGDGDVVVFVSPIPSYARGMVA